MPIIGLGASAGGIEAFRVFFEHMPADSGMGIVVVLHLPVNRDSMLPGILGRWTAMPVIEATEGCLVEANKVYLPPPGVVVILRDGRLHLHGTEQNEPREPYPISVFFDSLGTELGEDAIGVVLSGTGNDGALGLKAIRACGGLTLAQGSDGSGPQFGGMPASAIATGAVDIVAPVEAMAGRIMAMQTARHAAGVELPAEQTRTARLAICAILHRQLGHDFSGYKVRTFLRRVQRRMQVVGLATPEAYAARLEADRDEVVMLFRDLLIGVTSFFRDAQIFEAIRRTVVPVLFEDRRAGDTLRVWVAGCATGEEAYSLAMLLLEHAGTLGDEAPKIQVFATDIDELAIATARAGRYPASLLQDLSPERLERFFIAGNDGSYTVAKPVRELCTFSAHSLTRDPPFSKIHLVSCRNLLIYLDGELQSAIIPAFHYSLAPGGILLLGSSETISRHDNLFAPLDRVHRIFRRRDVPSPPLRFSGPADPRAGAAGLPARSDSSRIGAARMTNRASIRIQERYAPAFVVVTAEGEIVEYSSRTGRYLEAAPGLPSQSVWNMARPGLRSQLRAALRRAVETGRAVEMPGTLITAAGEPDQTIILAVEPLPDRDTNTRYLIAFIEAGRRSDRTERADHTPHESGADQLESELRDMREQLQVVTEEHETALQELRSVNEELNSVNEELQSTNEELETSKEEIQSINEELQTVNNQLAAKVDELDRKGSDLKNLFESTQVATVFLDPYLVIRGFTPAVASIYNLIPSDEGRPLTDIVSHLRYTGLREDVGQVLATLKPLERRVVRDDDSAHYLMRILPYRHPDSTIDGTLVTFVDVTTIVLAEQHQRLLVDELNHRVKNMLTVVISLATQTMQRATDMEDFGEVFLGRVHALTAAYSLLSDEAWQTASLRDILAEELTPFRAADGTNMVIEGPRVLLEPRAAVALGMAVHELTTNAVKYGALSVPEGVVSVTWRVEHRPKGQLLTLDWIERNGPPVLVPTRRGFGSTLIERGLRQEMSADVTMEFAEAGLHARLLAVLPAGHPEHPPASSGPHASSGG